MSRQYHTCEHCGSNLDPGERCDSEQASASETGQRSQLQTAAKTKEKTHCPPVQR